VSERIIAEALYPYPASLGIATKSDFAAASLKRDEVKLREPRQAIRAADHAVSH
jgi:hypothetical protein